MTDEPKFLQDDSKLELKQVNVRLRYDQNVQLKKYANLLGKNKSRLVREILDWGLEKLKAKLR